MKKIVTTLFIISALASTAASAADAGKQLVDSQCQQCHDNSIFTRKNSIIHNMDELKNRVEFCESANNKNWNSKQIDQVVKYLNGSFYKFPAK